MVTVNAFYREGDMGGHTVIDFAAAAATRSSRRSARTMTANDRELLAQLVDDLHVLIVQRPIVIRVMARFARQARQHTASSSSTG